LDKYAPKWTRSDKKVKICANLVYTVFGYVLMAALKGRCVMINVRLEAIAAKQRCVRRAIIVARIRLVGMYARLVLCPWEN
jgi:hypothetical protein